MVGGGPSNRQTVDTDRLTAGLPAWMAHVPSEATSDITQMDTKVGQ
jgi:hypothetical protein